MYSHMSLVMSLSSHDIITTHWMAVDLFIKFNLEQSARFLDGRT